MRAGIILLSTVALHFVVACSAGPTAAGPRLRDTSGFEAEWKKYLALEPHKAFAVAGETGGTHVFGSAHGAPTLESAVTKALRSCAVRRQEQKLDPICRTYAIDNTIVDAATD
jgi:hypothetical protein